MRLFALVFFLGCSGKNDMANHPFLFVLSVYINHKPITDYTESEILSALSHAKRLEPGGPPYVEGPPPPIKTKDKIVKEGLMSLLQQYGK